MLYSILFSVCGTHVVLPLSGGGGQPEAFHQPVASSATARWFAPVTLCLALARLPPTRYFTSRFYSSLPPDCDPIHHLGSLSPRRSTGRRLAAGPARLPSACLLRSTHHRQHSCCSTSRPSLATTLCTAYVCPTNVLRYTAIKDYGKSSVLAKGRTKQDVR